MIQCKLPGLCVFESALYQTTTTVVDTADMVLVVDPNWLPTEIARVVQYVYTIKGNRPLYLLFTHSDYDHIIAYHAFPGAKTIASASFVDNPHKAKEIEQIKAFDDKYYIQRNYAIEYPHIDIEIAKEEDYIAFENTRIRFWMAPGHNRDGLFALIEPLGIWIVGDYLSDIEFPFIYHSLSDYEETLEKAGNILSTSRPKVLVPGHGNACFEGSEMQNRLRVSSDYLQRLRLHIEGKTEFDEQWLWDQYHFPLGMKVMHEENIKIITKALNKR
ncbi:MAG: MBL fold metallo-hydrolase [Saprospiraceae bacterium]